MSKLVAALVAALVALALTLSPAAAQQVFQIGPAQVGGSSPLASGDIWVGNGSGIATAVVPSGDVTMTNAGAFTVAKIQGVVSGTPTGTGSVVFSASPTLTGTAVAATLNATNFNGILGATTPAAGTFTTVTTPTVTAASGDLTLSPASGQAINLNPGTGNVLNVNVLGQFTGMNLKTAGNGAQQPFGLWQYQGQRGTIVSPLAVANGDTLVAFTQQGWDGGNYRTASRIDFAVDNTVGSGFVPGRMVFNTASSSGTLVEAARIDSTQTLRISSGLTNSLTLVGSNANPTISTSAGGIAIGSGGGVTTAFTDSAPTMANLASSAAALDAVCWNAAGGVLTHNGAGALCSASLEELKDILGDISPAAAQAEVMALRPFWGKFKDSVTTTSDHRASPMLGARAVEAIDPRLAEYDGSGNLHGVRYTNLTALLVAAIQAQQAEIAALKAR